MDGTRDAEPWGIIDDGALLAEDGLITWVGPDAELGAELAPATEIDLGGALLTPGLIDPHTHLVYGGDRAAEFELRLQGASYEEIARAGGGISSTVAATRAASDDELFAGAAERAALLMAEGVTTLEVKSGYGLSREHEARCLAVARRLGRELDVEVLHDLARRPRAATRVGPTSRTEPTSTSRPPASGLPSRSTTGWSTRSTRSARRSRSRPRRFGGSSRRPRSSACR